MGRAILGRKIGMTQLFESDGRVHPVTVIEAGPCYVVQKKSQARDGYEAIQVGFGDMRERLATLHGSAGTLDLIAASAGGTSASVRFPLNIQHP